MTITTRERCEHDLELCVHEEPHMHRELPEWTNHNGEFPRHHTDGTACVLAQAKCGCLLSGCIHAVKANHLDEPQAEAQNAQPKQAKCPTCGSVDGVPLWRVMRGIFPAEADPLGHYVWHPHRDYCNDGKSLGPDCQPCPTCTAKKEASECMTCKGSGEAPDGSRCQCLAKPEPCKLCGGSGRTTKDSSEKFPGLVPCPNGCKVPEMLLTVSVDPELQQEVREWIEPRCPTHGEVRCDDKPHLANECYRKHRDVMLVPHFLCGCAKEQESGDGSGAGKSVADASQDEAQHPSPDSSPIFAEVASEITRTLYKSMLTERKGDHAHVRDCKPEIIAILFRRFGPLVQGMRDIIEGYEDEDDGVHQSPLSIAINTLTDLEKRP